MAARAPITAGSSTLKCSCERQYVCRACGACNRCRHVYVERQDGWWKRCPTLKWRRIELGPESM